jgi:transcription antitermination factor NusG
MTTSEAVGMCWHVVHSSHESEQRVQGALDHSPYKFYYPKTTAMRKVPKRELTASERNKSIPPMRRYPIPLFYRYYLVRFDPKDDSCWDLFRLFGIQGVICDSTGLRPAPVRDEFVDALRGLEIDGVIPGKITAKKLAYDIGERVRISNGVLSGFNAVVETLPDDPIEDLDESSRLRLLVSLFGRSSVVEMPIGDIEKL